MLKSDNARGRPELVREVDIVGKGDADFVDVLHSMFA